MAVRRIIKALLACVLGGVLFAYMYADAHAAAHGGKVLRLDMLLILAGSFVAAYSWVRFRKQQDDANRKRIPGSLAVLFAVLAVILISGIIKHPRFFFMEWIGDRWQFSYDFGFYRWLIFSLVLVPILSAGLKKTWLLMAVVLLYGQIHAFSSLMGETHGLALYRDDHPSFMFRLQEFAATFPVLLNYNPFWNGGVESFVGVSSGISSVGIPLYPLWRTFDVHNVYTPGLGILFIFVMPWIAVTGLRMAGCRLSGALAGGVMALAAGSIFFLWMLHFGTVGAAFSSSFILPLSAATMGVVWLGKRRWYHFVFVVACAFMLILWPPGVLMGLPLAVSYLLSWRKINRRNLIFLIAAVLCVGLLILHQVLVLMFAGNELMDYVTDQPAVRAPQTFWQGLIKGMSILVMDMNRANPVIVFLGLVGIWVIPYRSIRRWYLPLIIWLALLAGWGLLIEPKMQLDRMIIPMLFAAVVPASFACARILESRGGRSLIVRAALIGLLILCGRSAGQFYSNKSKAEYVTANEQLAAAVRWIRDNVPEGNRLLFAGKVVHAFNRGHVAYLPVMTGREMMACDYYHFPMQLVEYNYPPANIRVDVSKMDDFMSVYAVSHVVTHKDHSNWVMYFDGRKDRYEPMESGPGFDFRAYRVKEPGGIFVKNSGSVKADFNNIDLTVDDAENDVVVGYNWSSRFKTSGRATLFPYEVCDGVVLLGVRPNGEKNISIHFRGM